MQGDTPGCTPFPPSFLQAPNLLILRVLQDSTAWAPAKSYPTTLTRPDVSDTRAMPSQGTTPDPAILEPASPHVAALLWFSLHGLLKASCRHCGRRSCACEHCLAQR